MACVHRAWVVCCLFGFTGFAEPSVSSKQTNGSALFVCFGRKAPPQGKRMTEEPHIGNLIREELHQQGRSITWLGKQLGCSRQNIYKILRRNWIYTDMLLEISDLLDYDFFKCFSEYQNQKKRAENWNKIYEIIVEFNNNWLFLHPRYSKSREIRKKE